MSYTPLFLPREQEETQAIVQAAQQLAQQVARRKRRRTETSQIIIIGPFKPVVLDLASTTNSSISSTQSLLRLSTDHVSNKSAPSPPSTPTRPPNKAAAHPQLIDTPNEVVDWVAYGEPIEGLDIDNLSLGSSDMSSIRGSCKSSVKISPGNGVGPAILVEKASPHSTVSRGAAWTQSLLNKIEIVRPRSANAVMDRPPLRALTPNRWNFPQTAPSSGRTLVASELLGRAPVTQEPSELKQVEEQLQSEADLFMDEEGICSACDGRNTRMVHLHPCGDLACPSCFSSSVAAVSVTQTASKCPACIREVTSFAPYKPSLFDPIVRGPSRPKKIEDTPEPWSFDRSESSVVMRIDNVAWDIEPYLVENFLPRRTLPENHPQPIHICLDRRDGRTKDYMYIEVASLFAARRVLQTRQNAFMPGGRVTGGRKRAVTITQVTHAELIRELRPGSKSELLSLLELCEASLSTPTPQLRVDATGRGRLHASVGANGKVHYIKYRHAPFHALMSIMCKLRGQDSPAYWDVFHVASGAIAALATRMRHMPYPEAVTDRALMTKMTALFDTVFGTKRGKL